MAIICVSCFFWYLNICVILNVCVQYCDHLSLCLGSCDNLWCWCFTCRNGSFIHWQIPLSINGHLVVIDVCSTLHTNTSVHATGNENEWIKMSQHWGIKHVQPVSCQSCICNVTHTLCVSIDMLSMWHNLTDHASFLSWKRGGALHIALYSWHVWWACDFTCPARLK